MSAPDTYRGSVPPINIVLYILMLVMVSWLVAYLVPATNLTPEYLLFYLPLGVYIIYICLWQPTSIPFRYEVLGSKITTYGLRGKKILNFSDVDAIKLVWKPFGNSQSQTLYLLLKLTTADGAVMYLNLGSLSRKKRYELALILVSHLGTGDAKIQDQLNQALTYWFQNQGGYYFRNYDLTKILK